MVTRYVQTNEWTNAADRQPVIIMTLLTLSGGEGTEVTPSKSSRLDYQFFVSI